MTTREHLKSFHTKAAQHHVQMAKAHQSAAKCYAKADGMDGHEALSDAHNEMADQHTAMGEYHLECCKALDLPAMKTMGMDSRDQIVPDLVSRVITNYPGVRAVPRAGQREIPAAEVPPQFSKLVAVETGDDE